ncbi:MAG: hypothetical protein RIR39_1975 [Pseudomonadota bacterium]
MKLAYGNIDFPYGFESNSLVTTAAVAKHLEKKYHIYAAFHSKHGNDIRAIIQETLTDMLRAALSGAYSRPITAEMITQQCCPRIDQLFKKFLDDKEIEGMGIDGVPTKAALDGISHRFKNPRLSTKNKKMGLTQNPPRPSFIDRGKYRNSAKTRMKD